MSHLLQDHKIFPKGGLNERKEVYTADQLKTQEKTIRDRLRQSLRGISPESERRRETEEKQGIDPGAIRKVQANTQADLETEIQRETHAEIA